MMSSLEVDTVNRNPLSHSFIYCSPLVVLWPHCNPVEVCCGLPVVLHSPLWSLAVCSTYLQFYTSEKEDTKN